MEKKTIPIGIIVSGVLMILFGLAEVVTAFTHSFMGITTSTQDAFTFSSLALGIFYITAGGLLFTMKRWAAALAIFLLILDVIGRILLVVTGLFPTDTAKNTFSIIAGTLIAAFFAVYIATRWKDFS